MIVLKWAPFPNADVASYNVYRSIIGFRAPMVSLATLNGKTLQLKMNGGALQTITFNNITPIVDKINATLTGGRAYTSISNSSFFFVRSDIREAPGKVEIVGGTALADFGLTAHVIQEKTEDLLIENVEALEDPQELVELEDPDGAMQDFYALTSVNSLDEESNKTNYVQATSFTGDICVIEGIVTDLQGVRIPDAEVSVRLLKFPHSPEKASQVTLAPITTLSGSDGRFSIALLQGALVQFEIPAVGFSREITVPAKAFEFITDILVDLDYRYPLEFRE